jgi:cell division control protein 24
MEPTRALPSYLIRPVQRICKYPLLLRELIRYTDPKKKDILKDIQRGYESISRVTANINEISRRELNQKIAAELEKAVDDWKVSTMIHTLYYLRYYSFSYLSMKCNN